MVQLAESQDLFDIVTSTIPWVKTVGGVLPDDQGIIEW